MKVSTMRLNIWVWSIACFSVKAWEIPDFMVDPPSLSTSSIITQSLTVPGDLESNSTNPSDVGITSVSVSGDLETDYTNPSLTGIESVTVSGDVEENKLSSKPAAHTGSIVVDTEGQIRELNEDETESPTESPAPSPSPSEIPTQPPTITDKPTAEPTSDPTESPAPSPSPSEIPTLAPSDTPSSQPSLSPTGSHVPTMIPSSEPSTQPTSEPSKSPSIAPTLSHPPSMVPSAQPSNIPSSGPTVSLVPSAVPSVPPTISEQPSSSPTHIDQVSGNFFVNVKLRVPALRSEEMRAFERATKSWVEYNDATTGVLRDAEVTVLRQLLVDITTDSGEAGGEERKLQVELVTKPTEKRLQIKFSIVAIYAGTDKDFDLEKELSPYFEKEDPTWIDRLIAENQVFEPIKTGIADLGTSGATIGSGGAAPVDGVSIAPAGMATIALIAVGAIMLGTVASVYSIKSHRNGMYGEELRGPTNSSEDEDDARHTKKEALAFQSESMDMDERQAPIRASILSQKSTGIRGSRPSENLKENKRLSTEQQHINQMMSPNTMERGPDTRQDEREVVEPIHYNDPYSNRNQYPYNLTNQYNNRKPRPQRPLARDPPTAASEVSIPTGNIARPDPRQTSLADNNTEMSSQISDLTRSRMTLEHAELDQYEDARDVRDHREVIDSGNGDNRRLSNGSRTEGAEIMLTKSVGGTLGAAAVDGEYAESMISEQSEFFFMTKQQAAKNTTQEGGSTLGARPVAPEEVRQLQERSSYESVTQRAGLYDVFAPAGPIGIVVDTTKHGPAVHSLKPTSPMLGLINPGDLIVGLDDTDTRSMTAATLTRLMARKSNQKERKITLLAAESY